jgi:hypothetical protein
MALLAAVLGLLSSPADATVSVYASHDGVNRGVVALDTESPNDLDIWIDKQGTATSTVVCNEAQGDGDEICGYEVMIQVIGSGCLNGYFVAADPAIVHYTPKEGAFSCATTRTLRATLVDTSPADSEPVEIGQLTVVAVAEGTALRVWGEQIVTANLELEEIPHNTIAYVPEPGEILLLAGGIAGLAGLYRLRRGSLSAG